MRILIISTANDLHSILPLFCLRKEGHDVMFWSPSDMPINEQASIYFEGSSPSVDVTDSEARRSTLGNFDTILFRKYSSAQLPDNVNPADCLVAQREFGHFTDGCFSTIGPTAFWVNPWMSLFTCGKVRQLDIAKNAGFQIPPTLISCNPVDIRDFVSDAKPNGAIFKSFAPAVWQDAQGGRAVAMTAEINDEILANDFALSSAPGIYQHRISKSYEIRVTMFGSFGVFVKIDSQSEDYTSLDSRVGGSSLPLGEIESDETIRLKCIDVMHKLGISFGCFDLIVDASGDVIFLEVNPAGQFLWMEEINQEIPLFSRFCEFLVNGDFDFCPDVGSKFKSLAEIGLSKEFAQFRHKFDEKHVSPLFSFVSSE